MTEWDRQESLNDLGLKDVQNCRSCSRCGKPLIDIEFRDDNPLKSYECRKKFDDICVKCAISLRNI